MFFKKKRGLSLRSLGALVIAAVVVGTALNAKDAKRYLRMRTM